MKIKNKNKNKKVVKNLKITIYYEIYSSSASAKSSLKCSPCS